MADSTEPTTSFKPDHDSSDAGTPPAGPFQFSEFTPGQRVDIVNLTNPAYSRFGARYLDLPTLELSALGANAEILGSWNPTGGLSNITDWHHLGQGGRTVKAQVTQRGYLFPLGHRAILTTYFERVFAVGPKGAYPVAYLQMHSVMRVTEPIKTYGPGTVGEPWTTAGAVGASDWPFSSVRMVTIKTPDLDPAPQQGAPAKQLLLDANDPTPYQAFWPTYNNLANDVEWTFVLTDLAGRDVTMTMPLVFVFAYDKAHNSPYGSSEFAVNGFTDQLAHKYHDQTTHSRYSRTGGVPVMFAPESGGVTGGTTHPTHAIMLGAATSSLDYNPPVAPSSPGAAALSAAGQPNFYPVIRRARIRLHAAEVLTGQDQDGAAGDALLPVGGGVEVNYYPAYVSDPRGKFGSAGSNAGAVFLALSESFSLNLPANKVGGIGTPSTGLSGLSATAGAVGGTLSSFAGMAPYTNLSDYFPAALDPQLLGGLHLSDIIDPSTFNMPQMSSSSVTSAAAGLIASIDGGGPEYVLDDVTTGTDPSTGAHTVTYTLNTALQSTPADNPLFVPDPTGSGMLSMTTVVSAPTDGSPPTYSSNGTLDPFEIHLASSNDDYILMLHFETVTFTSGSGQSTAVQVNLDNVEFEGCLEFVNTLEEFLKSLGAGGLAITVEPTQVTLGLSFSLPAIQTGVFNLSGISFHVGAVLPFLSGKAICTFGFASQDNPFTLTYLCCGGGGFVSLGVGFGGLQTLQAQFEAELQVAIGIVVASGQVELSLGIYFAYDETNGASLTGFVQLSGQVELLGIVTVSITMNISLTWEITAGAVQGTATLEVGISICGFGVSVGVTVSKSFGGGSAPASVSASTSADISDGHPEYELMSRQILPTADLHRLAPPIHRTTPIVFTELISKTNWASYCDAFRT